MTATILAIGLDPTLVNELTQVRPEKVITTECCDEAINVLRLWDVMTIVINARDSDEVKTDVDKLLSATPVTTRIVLISPDSTSQDDQNYSGMGVTTLTSPVSSADLEPFFH